MLDLEPRLDIVSVVLRDHRHLWEPRPFAHLRLAWEADHPEVSAWLRALPEAQVEALERDAPLPPDAPAALLGWDEIARSVSQVPRCTGGSLPARLAGDRELARRVKGRKWAQIRAFAGVLLDRIPEGATGWVDWCAGKGHLGRVLGAASGLPVTAVEREAWLCDDGARLAARSGVDSRFLRTDAGSGAAAAALAPGCVAVGLHPCGDLGRDLLVLAAAREVRSVALASCCYHRVRDLHAPFEPMSDTARATGVSLTRHALRLPTADEVSAREPVRAARRREMAWRLGLDRLLREAGRAAYTPLGTIPRAQLTLPFGPFCRALAEARELELPPGWDEAEAEAAGVERARVARALGVVRQRFRRPLELWLVLDRALYLAEAGRPVRLETFCDRSVTPRNLLLTSSLR